MSHIELYLLCTFSQIIIIIITVSEAHLAVWTEMVVSVFDLISQLSDAEVRPVLPIVFPSVAELTAHAHAPTLRQILAELITRLAHLYGFSPKD